MILLQYFILGLVYTPFLITPFIVLFWYAFAPIRQDESTTVENEKRQSNQIETRT